jgi:hypothetical protein
MPSRVSSTLIGSGLVGAVASYDKFAIIAAAGAIVFEAIVFFNDGLG